MPNASLTHNLAEIRGRIGAGVELVAVTKGCGPDVVRSAIASGCTMLGENYAQELLSKDFSGARLHFIGRIQSNKVRLLSDVVDVWESVDRTSVLDEIAKRQPGATVLIQVNATSEPGKGGCSPSATAGLVAHGLNLNLDVNGVMTVGPTSGDPAATRTAFRIVRRLADDLALPTCSMGMTHDLDIALDCGTTRVRVGTALFGARAG